MYRWVILFAAAVTASAGCGGKKAKYSEEELALIPVAQREGLPAPSGGFVLSVGQEVISADEVVEPLVERLGESARQGDFENFRQQVQGIVERAVVSRISDVLLYERARAQAGADVEERLDKLAEQEVQRFVAKFGGNWAQAEQAIRQSGKDWESFKEYQKKIILTQSYVAQKIPKSQPITYSELRAEYARMKEVVFTTPAQVQIRLIDIRAGEVEVSDANAGDGAAANQLAAELAERLRVGADFGKLAKKYSVGHRAEYGGLWEPVNPESLAEPYDVLGHRAMEMKAGELAEPIEAGGHIFLMQLVERQPYSVEPFEAVQGQVEAKIRFERRKEMVERFGAELAHQASVGIQEEFVSFCVQRLFLLCNM